MTVPNLHVQAPQSVRHQAASQQRAPVQHTKEERTTVPNPRAQAPPSARRRQATRQQGAPVRHTKEEHMTVPNLRVQAPPSAKRYQAARQQRAPVQHTKEERTTVPNPRVQAPPSARRCQAADICAPTRQPVEAHMTARKYRLSRIILARTKARNSPALA